MQASTKEDSTNSWDEMLKTPKEAWPETPPEQYVARVGSQDPVEAQFDHLLVRPSSRVYRLC